VYSETIKVIPTTNQSRGPYIKILLLAKFAKQFEWNCKSNKIEFVEGLSLLVLHFKLAFQVLSHHTFKLMSSRYGVYRSTKELASWIILSGSSKASLQSSLHYLVSDVLRVGSGEMLWLQWWRCVLQVLNNQADMSGKTYHVGVTNVEDLTPESSTFS
jgi:hypothetical protein